MGKLMDAWIDVGFPPPALESGDDIEIQISIDMWVYIYIYIYIWRGRGCEDRRRGVQHIRLFSSTPSHAGRRGNPIWFVRSGAIYGFRMCSCVCFGYMCIGVCYLNDRSRMVKRSYRK